MTIIRTMLLTTLLAAVMTPLASADTLSILNASNGVERPQRGMNMDQVRDKFGPANEELTPVGEPPITRWVYGDFTVYYEHKLVIDSVVHNGHAASSADDDGPLFLLD